jgi:hypothetical protein
LYLFTLVLGTLLAFIAPEGFSMFSPSKPALKMVLTGHDLLYMQSFPSLARWFDRFNLPTSGKISSSSLLSCAEITRELPISLLETGMPSELSSLLRIEYHHLNACISALSIQAVVERALLQGATQPQTPNAPRHRPFMHPKDRDHIDKAISASCEVLERATAMLVEGRLRYAPRRTRVCIISASTLLLKAISLGGSAHDLKVKMGKLDQCIAALRLCGIDDLDFLSRYGELI